MSLSSLKRTLPLRSLKTDRRLQRGYAVIWKITYRFTGLTGTLFRRRGISEKGRGGEGFWELLVGMVIEMAI